MIFCLFTLLSPRAYLMESTFFFLNTVNSSNSKRLNFSNIPIKLYNGINFSFWSKKLPIVDLKWNNLLYLIRRQLKGITLTLLQTTLLINAIFRIHLLDQLALLDPAVYNWTYLAILTWTVYKWYIYTLSTENKIYAFKIHFGDVFCNECLSFP